MATNAPIKISEQATIIESALNTWASDSTRGGTAKVVPNLKQLWIQSAMDTQSLRILICFGGARRRGPFTTANATHREDRVWKIAVTKGTGLTAERGEFLTQQTGNTDPFFDEVETIRDIFRWIPNISAEAPANDYEGIEPMQLGDTLMSGYLITGTTANDIPQPINQTTPQ